MGTTPVRNVANSARGATLSWRREGRSVAQCKSVTTSAGVAAGVDIRKQHLLLHARFISRWKYRFSSDQRSQAPLSSVSTGVGDQPGTLSDLAFLPPEVRGTRNSLVEPATCAGNIVRRNGNYLKY